MHLHRLFQTNMYVMYDVGTIGNARQLFNFLLQVLETSTRLTTIVCPFLNDYLLYLYSLFFDGDLKSPNLSDTRKTSESLALMG